MVPMSLINPKAEQTHRYDIHAETADRLRRVTVALFHLWQDQPDLSWEEALDAAAALPVKGWDDERTRWLVDRIATPTPPREAWDLGKRIEQIVREARNALPPEGVRFGDSGGAQWSELAFPADTQLAQDNESRLVITGPEAAAHPTTLSVPRADGLLDPVEATPHAVHQTLVSYAGGRVSIGGRAGRLVTVPLTFRYKRVRFVNQRTAEPVVVRGKPFELLSMLDISAGQDTWVAPVIDHATLTFKITMTARADGVAGAKVSWKLTCAFANSLTMPDHVSTGTLSIGRGDGDQWAFTSESGDVTL